MNWIKEISYAVPCLPRNYHAYLWLKLWTSRSPVILGVRNGFYKHATIKYKLQSKIQIHRWKWNKEKCFSNTITGTRIIQRNNYTQTPTKYCYESGTNIMIFALSCHFWIFEFWQQEICRVYLLYVQFLIERNIPRGSSYAGQGFFTTIFSDVIYFGSMGVHTVLSASRKSDTETAAFLLHSQRNMVIKPGAMFLYIVLFSK